ncbi:MAG TPA: thermonuclease family protein [Burkholderiales bacterium]|nr:thermonuclease family protein [Burkholderiales bacterium]
MTSAPGTAARKRTSAYLGTVLGAVLLVSVPRHAALRGQALRSSDEVSGTVTYVYDGDTIKVRLETGKERRVRLIGVDSPELDDPQEPSRLMAFLARRFADWNLSGKPVRLTRDKEEADAYGRLLAYVWTDSRTMFNETLVRQGFARAYLKYPFDETVKARLEEAEAEARAAGRGLWREKPWDIVGAGEAARRLGEVVTVRFLCVRMFERRRFMVLVPAEGDFEAVVPRDVLKSFPGSLDFERRTVEVTGLIEEFRGRPQVVIGLAAQVKTGV